MTLLTDLRQRRTTLVDEMASTLESRNAVRATFDESTPTDEARAAFTAAETAFAQDFAQREAVVAGLDQRINEQETVEQRRAQAAAASVGDARVTGEPLTYRADNARSVSYFRDLAYTNDKVATYMPGDRDAAIERLERHGKEVGEWVTRRDAERERRANEQIDLAEREHARSRGMDIRGFDSSPFEIRSNPDRSPGHGGYGIPPLWLIDEFIPLLRAGRVAADLCRKLPLPEGTDSINIPKMATGTKVDIQTFDGAAVASQDFTDTSVQANIKTIAGQQDVAIQLLDQSPGQVLDLVILQDLMADYNLRVDRQILTGNGTNAASLNGGQLLGLYPANNWGATTVQWTSGSPSGNAFNMVLGAMASKTATNRYDLSNFNFLTHPRRWFWYATALDGPSGTSGRPLVNHRDVGVNVTAVGDGAYPAQGHVGQSMLGPDVYIDANVPTTDNGSGVLSGTNDVAIGAKWDDLWLFEGEMRTRVMEEVLSGTLQVRYQVYNYVAFLVRYGPSVTIAQGTGLVPPVAAFDSIAF